MCIKFIFQQNADKFVFQSERVKKYNLEICFGGNGKVIYLFSWYINFYCFESKYYSSSISLQIASSIFNSSKYSFTISNLTGLVIKSAQTIWPYSLEAPQQIIQLWTHSTKLLIVSMAVHSKKLLRREFYQAWGF